MKKLMMLMVMFSSINSVYGTSIGLGVAYDGIGRSMMGEFLSLRADIMCKIVPALYLRVGLISLDIDDYYKTLQFGTGTSMRLFLSPSAMLCLIAPIPSSVKPYLPVGFHLTRSSGDLGSTSTWLLHGGMGAMFDLATIQAYLEGGITLVDYEYYAQSQHWFYVQGGLRVPIGL